MTFLVFRALKRLKLNFWELSKTVFGFFVAQIGRELVGGALSVKNRVKANFPLTYGQTEYRGALLLKIAICLGSSVLARIWGYQNHEYSFGHWFGRSKWLNDIKTSKEAKTNYCVQIHFWWSISLILGTNFEYNQTQTVQMYTLSSD